jgi:hypothetical protein
MYTPFFRNPSPDPACFRTLAMSVAATNRREEVRATKSERERDTEGNARVFGSMASVLSSRLLWSLPAFLPSRYSFSANPVQNPAFF